jgi:prevent-host-death family protein
MHTQIGAYEAKTRLPELLRQVREGKRFTITNRGEAIADLVPSATAGAPDAKAAIEKFQAQLRDNPPQGLRGRSLDALIDEGRE